MLIVDFDEGSIKVGPQLFLRRVNEALESGSAKSEKRFISVIIRTSQRNVVYRDLQSFVLNAHHTGRPFCR